MLSSGAFPIEKSDLYAIWLEEKQHIEKNKWYMSEKAGYEISKEMAEWNWNMVHRKKWWDSVTGRK